jgi:hypothetical protein
VCFIAHIFLLKCASASQHASAHFYGSRSLRERRHGYLVDSVSTVTLPIPFPLLPYRFHFRRLLTASLRASRKHSIACESPQFKKE